MTEADRAALQQWKRHVLTHPEDPDGWMALATMALRAGEDETAIQGLERAVAYHPGHEGIRTLLVELLMRQRLPDRALQHAYSLIELAPARSQLILQTTELLIWAGMTQEALALLTRLRAQTGDEPPVLRALAATEAGAGRLASAIPIWKRLAVLQPGARDVLGHLTDAYLALGERRRALALYRRWSDAELPRPTSRPRVRAAEPGPHQVNVLYVLGEVGALQPAEAIMTPGSGRLRLSGNLAPAFVESAELAHAHLSSEQKRYQLPDMAKVDIHVNLPAWERRKDGGSAGLALSLLIHGLLTGNRLPADLAVTGELGVGGAVRPIAGLPAKLRAAYNAGMRSVMMPAQNFVELAPVPMSIKCAVRPLLVTTLGEACAVLAQRQIEQ